MLTVIPSHDCPKIDYDDVEYNGVIFLNVDNDDKDLNDDMNNAI